MTIDMKHLQRTDSNDGTLKGAAKTAYPMLMNAEEVAQILGVSKAFVYKLVREGQLEAIHLGRLVRFTPESIYRLMDCRSACA